MLYSLSCLGLPFTLQGVFLWWNLFHTVMASLFKLLLHLCGLVLHLILFSYVGRGAF